jgi:hypothetical protein
VVGMSKNGTTPFASSHAVIPMLYTSDFSLYPRKFCQQNVKSVGLLMLQVRSAKFDMSILKLV